MKSVVRCLLVLAVAVTMISCTTDKREETGTKVLMIGNSFSISCLSYLPQVAKDLGLDLDLASLYIGGCSLTQHWANVEKDLDRRHKPYLFGRNTFGAFENRKANVCEALRMAKWDIVTIQQASSYSWHPNSYHPWGDYLVEKIRELAPQAKIVVQETWSYTPWDKRFKNWTKELGEPFDQDAMYDRLHAAYADFAKKHGLEVIPFGTAVQEWRKRLPVKYTARSFGGDVVGGRRQKAEDAFKRMPDNTWAPNCDVFHLNEKGEYFQAIVWAKCLLKADLESLNTCPDFVTEDEQKLMKAIAEDLCSDSSK